MLTDSEIHERFLQLWNQKGDLLVYKTFVSLYPGYALWYDQIYGSIPPEGEVEIADTDMGIDIDVGCLDTESLGSVIDKGRNMADKCEKQKADTNSGSNNREHVCSGISNKEHVCSGISNKEHVYSDINYKEHICNGISNKEHVCSDINYKEHICNGISNKQHVCSDVSNKEHVYSDVSKKEHVYSDVSNKGHVYSDVSNKEHVYSDSGSTCAQNIKHSHGDIGNNGHIYCDTRDKEEPRCTPSNESRSSTTQHEVIINKDLITNSLFSEKHPVHPLTSGLHHIGRMNDGPSFTHEDVPSMSGGSAERFHSGNSGFENTGTSNQINLDCGTSHYISNSGGEKAGSVQHFDEHGYSLSQNNNCFSRKILAGGGCCTSDAVSDDDDDESENNHEEAIAALKDAHGDLRNQVYSHVKDKFSQWLRSHQDEEFDVSWLDGDFVPDYHFSETELVVWVDNEGMLLNEN